MSARVGARPSNAGFISASALTLVWVLPIAILVMNAVKSKKEYLFGSGLDLPTTFSLFDNLARAWSKGLGSGFANSLIYGNGRNGVTFIDADGVPGAPDVRGRVGMLDGEMPAGRLHDLQSRLPDLTRGEGVLESGFAGYRPVTGAPPSRPRTDQNPLDRADYLRRRKGVGLG